MEQRLVPVPTLHQQDSSDLQVTELPAAEHVEERVVTARCAVYQLTLGGTLDSFNTASHTTTDNDKTMMEAPRFQPDRFVRLANAGDVDVVNPRLSINGRRTWHTADELLTAIVQPAMDSRDRAFALFRFFSRTDVHAHSNDLRVDDLMPDLAAAPGFNSFRERADPIKAINSYYPSGCIHSAANLVIMARHAGLQARLVAAAPLGGPYDRHGGAEIYYNGEYHYFDPEAAAFFLRRDNKTVASYEDIHRDPDLVLRTHAHGFAAQDCKGAFLLLYREHFPPYEIPVEQWTHRMDVRLRPGEELVYRWDHVGKYRYGSNPRQKPGLPYRLANGLLIYQPRLRDPRYRGGILHEVNVASPADGSAGLHPAIPGHPASILWKVESAYPIVGARISGRFALQAPGKCSVSVCTGPAWNAVWQREGRGQFDLTVDIDAVLDALTTRAIYAYYVRFQFETAEEPSSVRLETVRFETDLQMAETSLPALSVGLNNVSVRTDNREAGARLRILHGWNESADGAPPSPPTRAVAPVDGSDVDPSSLTELVWAHDDAEDIVDHHIIVSTRPDFLMPVSPNFDRLTFHAEPRWKVSRSFLRVGTFYWRVRTRSRQGVWSDWGPTWTFHVVGDERHAV